MLQAAVAVALSSPPRPTLPPPRGDPALTGTGQRRRTLFRPINTRLDTLYIALKSPEITFDDAVSFK